MRHIHHQPIEHKGNHTMAKDFEKAADWAEQDMALPEPSATTRTGDDAADYGSEILSRGAGRPAKDPSERRSVVLQIRISPTELADLEEVAAAAGEKTRSWARDAVLNRVNRAKRNL
ncbi:hypothetical protein [Promicromonospora sp. NFX87]|uniref:hypothetical protein n=1 Tax=Promicromonospora sp. NFX87 TaxID=3402691 RepID=UPI003AFAA87D